MFNLSSIRASAAALALAASALITGGCDLIDAFSDPGDTLITVFANHHATPENGAVPHRGDAGDYRVFENDEGWTVQLTDGLITTSGVTLHRCDGAQAPVEFYFGSVAEDLRSADLDRRTLGGTEVGASEFCGVTVHYAPFSAQRDEAPASMDAAVVDGLTVYLAGVAEKDGQRVPFTIEVEQSVDAFADLSARPLRIRGNESFPIEMTVSKTYDRFFDGVDFDTLDEDDLEAQALAIVELETRVDVGS